MKPHHTAFARKADAIWKSRYFGGVIIFAAALACVYWLFHVPAPGTAVTVLAAASAVMAFRADSGGVEKSAFMLVLFGLLYVELHAIRQAAKEQNEQFNASITKQEKLAKQTIDMITGGDGYCYLQLSRDFHQMVLVRKGESPLYDVNATFVDQSQVTKLLAKGTPTLEELESIKRHLVVGNLGSETSLGLKNILPPPISGDASFVINFNGRNGFWNQDLQVHKTQYGWTFATRVSRQIIGKAGIPVLAPIFVRVDEGFPKPVDWQK